MPQPNILIFMTDHQRGDTVLPGSPVRMPNVNRLATEGVTFSETYCPSPHCCPSRATFHSGLYPQRTGIWNNVCNGQALQYGLNEGVRLWSEDLAAAGYTMAYVGKWHVSAEERPSQRGWVRDAHASALVGILHGQTWEEFRALAREPDPAVRPEGYVLRPGWGTAQVYGTVPDGEHGDLDRLGHGLGELDRLTAGKEPWALCLNTSGPHDPYLVPRSFVDQYDLDRVSLPPNFTDAMADKPRIYGRMRRQVWGQMSEREYREAIRHFWAYCTFMDDLFGRLLARLEASGQADNTVVLYISDHGDYCGEHGLFAKGIPAFHGADHVPAVMRWPAGIAAPGRTVDALVSLADFAPTFLESAGIGTDRAFSGRSLVPFLRDRVPDNWRDDLLMLCNGVELYYTQRILMTGRHKYVYNGFDEDELYDRTRDPHEMVNRSGDPAYTAVKREMVGRMWRAMHREGDTAINAYFTVALAPWGPVEAWRDAGRPD
ncbi:MAG: sulfatase-like hydrolase/transferase [Planctomycetota bacterium]